jgi:hypothetical protein
MRREEDGYWNAFLKADKRVLPVTEMITKADVQDRGPEVEGVKVEPKGVEDVVTFVNENQDRWSRRTTR